MTSCEIKLVNKQEDSPQLALHASHLGYPSTTEQVATQPVEILARSDQAVFKAELDGWVAGWVHVYGCPTVESDYYAEIGDLVVDQNRRGLGVGKAHKVQAEA